MKTKFFNALSLAVIMAILLTSLALADQIANNLDGTVDSTFEVMSLTVGGSTGSTSLYYIATNDDGKSGCNLTGPSSQLSVSIASSNTSVATVSPSSMSFADCNASHTLTVTPVGQGTANITVSFVSVTTNVSGITSSDFNLLPGRFTVNVDLPSTNNAPVVVVTGVSEGASYEFGSVPLAGCSVADDHDGNPAVSPDLSAISGALSAYGLGTQTATCSYTDSGNLTTTVSATYSIVDTTAPIITFVGQTPAANGNGWNNTDVTLEWSCSDNVGVVSATASQTLTSEGANQSATGTCEDVAGNIASDTQTGINIDKTAPTIVAAVTAGTLGSNGWYVSDVTVHFTCADNISAVVACPADQVLSTEGSSVSSTAQTVTDLAGNTSAPSNVVTVKIDKTAPTLSPSISPNPVLLNGSAIASANASDATSGLASSGCDPVVTNAVGTFSVNCTATDNAGNTATKSASYTVSYNVCALYDQTKSHKSGSTVPLKLQLCDVNGVNYSSASIVVHATGLSKVDSLASALVDDSGSANSPDNNFRYDASLAGYIFNLSTKGLSSGTWKVTFTVDGQGSYFVTFDIK